MTFEEALRTELIELTGLSNKVFPLVVPKDSPAPFVVYKKRSVKYLKTMSRLSSGISADYDVVILAEDYAQLQQLGEAIKDKTLSFWQRNIGTTGPYIQNVTVEFTGDAYDYEANLLRSNIRILVDY